MDVATLVQQMHDNLVEIHKTIATVESSEHHAKLEELEKKRDALLASIREAFDEEHAKIRDQRVEESMKIADIRRQEDEERERRRLAEDAELESKRASEDEAKLKKLDEEMDLVEDEMDEQMDEIEKAAHSEIEAGERKIKELEDKRREINRLIDEKLQQPLLPLPMRKRTRYARRGSRARGRSSPTPPKVASDETAVEAVKAATADAPPAPEIEAPATETRALAVKPSPADSPVDAPFAAPVNAADDARTTASSDLPADVPAAVPTETVAEAPKDLPTDTPNDAPAGASAKALTALSPDVSAYAPDDTSAAISTETPTITSRELPADAPTNAPTDSSTDLPAEVSTDVTVDILAATSAAASTKIPADAPISPSTDSATNAPKEVPMDAPTPTRTDLPVPSSAETPKEASTGALDDIPAEAVEAKPVKAAKPEQEEADAVAVETSASKDVEPSNAVEEIASEPVKPVDDGPEETSKVITEAPARGEVLQKPPKDITEPTADLEDTKPKVTSDEVKDAILEDAPQESTPEPKIVAEATDATEADPAPGATEALAAEVPIEATVIQAHSATEDATGVKDDVPSTDTPAVEAAEISTSNSHSPIEKSLSKDTDAEEPPSDKDTVANEPHAESVSLKADKEDTTDAKAPVESSPAAPEAISEKAAEATPEKLSEEPSAKVPEEAAAKDAPINGAPVEAAEVASLEATANDLSEDPTSSDESKVESTTVDVSAKNQTQAGAEEAAAPEVDAPEAVAKDAPAADAAVEASVASAPKESEKLAEEAVTKDAPDTTVAADNSPTTPEEAIETVSKGAAAKETPEAGFTSHASSVTPGEASEKVDEGTSDNEVSEVELEEIAEVASEKAADAGISVPSSTANPEEAPVKPSKQIAVTAASDAEASDAEASAAEASDAEASDAEASDAEAPAETSPSKFQKVPKTTDEFEAKDASVAKTPIETPHPSAEGASEKAMEELATKDSTLAIPEEASDDEEATTKNVSAVGTSADTPVDNVQVSHEEAKEKAAVLSAAKDAPVAESLQETPAEILQASRGDTSLKASSEIDDKYATDNKTAAASAEKKASGDKIPGTASVDSIDSSTASQEETPAISKTAVSPLAVQEDSGIGLQASTGATDKSSPPASPSGGTSLKTADEKPPATGELAVAETFRDADDFAIASRDLDSDDALSDATEGLNSPRASLIDSDDSYIGESVAEPLEGPEVLSAATKLEPSQSSALVEALVATPGKTLEAIEGETQAEKSHAAVSNAAKKPEEESGVRSLSTSETKALQPSVEKPEPQPENFEAPSAPKVTATSEDTPTGTETTLTSKSIDDDDNDLAHVQEASPTHSHEAPKSQSQTAQNLDQELREAPMVTLEKSESPASQTKVGGSSEVNPMTVDSEEREEAETEGRLDTKKSSAAPEKQHSTPELDYDSSDESERERDAPAAAKEGQVAATDPINDSPIPGSGHVTTPEELAPEVAHGDKTGEGAHVSEGTLNVPSIRLNGEKDDTMAPATPVETPAFQDAATPESAKHAQPSDVESVRKATGLASASGQGVDLVPSRQSSHSPLPVENTTVDGQEALFDDDSISTDNEEDVAGDKIKESIVSYDPEEDEGPPTARLPVDGITRFRGNEVKSYEHLREADVDKSDLDLEQSRHASGSPDSSSDLGDFAPRDVTNVAWRDRSESVNSFSTMSSTPSSPVQSMLHSDRHEPAIRDAWPASLGAASRSRGYSQLTNNTSVGSTTDDFDPFRYDGNNMATKPGGIPSPPLPQFQDQFRPQTISQPRDFHQPQEYGQTQGMPQAKEDTSPRDFPLAPPESQAAANRSSLAGSPMFAKLRGMFEGQQSANNQSDANPPRSGSPTSSRPASAFFSPVGRERSSSLRKSVNARDDNSEQSSLLGTNEGASSMGRH